MQTSDKSKRAQAIVFKAPWFDNNVQGNIFDPAGVLTSGDLAAIQTGSGGSSLANKIRIVRPAKGDLISGRLTMAGTVPSGGTTTMRFAVGTFDTDGITAVVPDEPTIKKHMKTLFGSESALSYSSGSAFLIDAVDFARIIPRRGETNFSEDGWVLYVEITTGTPANWVLSMFKIDCQMNLGVL